MPAPATIPIIFGPTASGKSALALALADALNGTVINADSMQVYHDLRILTARPTPEDMRRAPHRLYGVMDGAEACSAARWRDMAAAAVEETLAAERAPILCGGTGLYIRALTRGLSPVPDIPADIREEVRQLTETSGAAGLRAALLAEDPEIAARLTPNDTQRMARALEVMRATGRSLAHWRRLPPPPGMRPPWRFLLVAVRPPRPILRARIAARAAAMVNGGAAAEVEALAARRLDPTLPVMRALGVRPIMAWLSGATSKEDALARLVTDTRRYAKRQSTWLARQVSAAMTLNAAIVDADAAARTVIQRLKLANPAQNAPHG